MTSERPPRRVVVAWGLWNAGASGYHSVVLTFVFTVYLTGTVGRGLPAEAYLGYAVGAAGLVIGVVAPAVGRRVDESGRPVRTTAVFSGLTALAAAALVLVEPEPGWLGPGLLLLGLGLVFYDLATVPYNALLRRVTTPATLGRVSAFGWSMGYVGGVGLLVVVLVGFVGGGLPTEDAWNLRLVGPLAAVWFLALAVPLLVTVRDPAPRPSAGRGTYRRLWRDLRALYAQDRPLLRFLVASALYRDGLMAIAAFGGIIAVTVYGLDAADVPVFGIAAGVVAAVGALLGGAAEDRWGLRPVIVGSLLSMLALGVAVLVSSGVLTYWVLGLAISLLNGPVQSSSRTLVARLAPPGHEGRLFGLYTATGRALAFLAPSLFGTFIAVTGSPRAGIVGILVVLLAGTLAFLWTGQREATRSG